MIERPSNIKESLEQFRKDTFYFDNNREILAEEYPASYVGIYEEKVVGSADTMEELIDQLKKDGIKPGLVFVGHTAPADRVILAPSNFDIANL